MITNTRKFAQDTKVSAKQSREEIEALLTRHGANAFMFGSFPGGASVQFFLNARLIRFKLELPNEKQDEQEFRRRFRALLLVIKGKLESMDGTVETFETAFMAHTVLPDNRTVAEAVLPSIADAYATGVTPTMALEMPPQFRLKDKPRPSSNPRE